MHSKSCNNSSTIEVLEKFKVKNKPDKLKLHLQKFSHFIYKDDYY